MGSHTKDGVGMTDLVTCIKIKREENKKISLSMNVWIMDLTLSGGSFLLPFDPDF